MAELASIGDVDDAMESSSSLLIAFLSSGCGECRQVAANMDWAAKEIASAPHLHFDVIIAKVAVDKLSESEWQGVQQRFALASGEGRDRAGVKWLAALRVAHDLKNTSISGDRSVESCHSYTSANGLFDYIKGAEAAKEIGNGLGVCDGCRLVMEAMHLDWHKLLTRLHANNALIIQAQWQVKLDEAEAQDAIRQVASSVHMSQLSDDARHSGDLLFKWYGTRMVGQHLQLFTSWCKRSGDASQELSAQALLECAAQWSAKVPNGRLALHEKIMGVCGKGVGGVANVCEFAPSGWQSTKRLPSQQQIRPSKCAACMMVVDDLQFVVRTSKLALLPLKTLRARSMDLELLLDDVCQQGYNRHEGDATEGPARVVESLCSSLFDRWSDEILQATMEWAGAGGSGEVRAGGAEADKQEASSKSDMHARICVQISRTCKKSALTTPPEWDNVQTTSVDSKEQLANTAATAAAAAAAVLGATRDSNTDATSPENLHKHEL